MHPGKIDAPQNCKPHMGPFRTIGSGCPGDRHGALWIRGEREAQQSAGHRCKCRYGNERYRGAERDVHVPRVFARGVGERRPDEEISRQDCGRAPESIAGHRYLFHHREFRRPRLHVKDVGGAGLLRSVDVFEGSPN